MKKRVLATLMCCALALGLVTGCASEKKEEVSKEKESKEKESKEEKVMTVGIAGDFYPFCFTENDESKGFEIDVLNEIGKRAGYEVKYVVADFTGLFGMLDSGKIDTVGHSVAITDERQEKYLISDPYVYSKYNIITKKDAKLNVIKDFEGKKVGVVMGGQGDIKLNELCKNENIAIDIKGYEGTAAMDEDVLMGRIDGRLGPVIQTSANIKKNDLDLKVTDATVFSEIAGYPMPKDEKHEKMLDDVNEALKAMRDDGTLKELSMKWFELDVTNE